MDQGYAIASINAHLSTVKVYAKLATKAGILSSEEYAHDQDGQRLSSQGGQERRPETRGDRVGDKKAEAVPLTQEQAKALKEQSETLHRDDVMPC